MFVGDLRLDSVLVTYIFKHNTYYVGERIVNEYFLGDRSFLYWITGLRHYFLSLLGLIGFICYLVGFFLYFLVRNVRVLVFSLFTRRGV